ncbi:MAG TPA: hypothetical protein VHN99_08105 [Deinococcales bacterium]|nr:hypothetical protein [Deinococcales bacterium]
MQAQSMTLGAIKSLTRAGTSTLQAGAGLPQGVDGLQSPEFPTAAEGEAAGGALSPAGPNWNPTNRSLSNGKQPHGVSANAGKKAKSNPELQLSFDGLNFRQQRLANGGNQFSVEPPDQGLCAGSGYVLESVNDVLRVYDQAGGPAMGVTDLNTFYGYIPAINRQTGVRGPFVTDPSCYYDQQTSRWFHVVLTLDTAPNGAFLGTNHLDLAVSQTSSPLGAWTIYKLDVSADGTNCVSYFCLGDYPHIGADANGIYLTTNAYQFFGNDYSGAQVYGISKRALAAGASTVPVAYFDTYSNPTGHPGFTIWPATTPDNQFAGAQGGTEYFLSSMAADEANAPAGGTGSSSQLSVWALTNTKSLDTNSPALSLSVNTVNVGEYGIPPAADQKAGDFPLGQCLNSAPCATNYILGYPDPFVEVLSKLDSNDTRMQQVTYANGKLWGALDTGLTINGQNKAGIAWYVLNPSVSGKQVSAKPVLQGYLGLENNNLTYPAIGVTKSGRGVMAFTVVGQDHYPSAGYAGSDAIAGVGDVHIAAEGLGPQDGFTGYKGEVGNPPRPRWGDYGATAVDGNTVWMASEYIGQTCTLAQYTSAPFGSCGGTRATLGNWATRISAVKP